MTSCSVEISGEADVAVGISRVRRLLEQAQVRREDVFRITTVVAELGRNIFKYAGCGNILVELERHAGSLRVRVRSFDEGPGIDDIEAALRDGFSTGGSLGMGLPGVRRLMDDFSIVSTPGGGTRVMCHRQVGTH